MRLYQLMRQFVIVVLYSAILLSLEVIYRKLFNISSIERYTESYLSVCLFVCLFFQNIELQEY
ncbi:hypothetical protein NTHiID19_01530 [Haemophilus influenzae]|nr:hypothetical protein CHBNII1_01570 [Haemophilus influenzae]BBE83462.1 hypothetical protein CHBNII2_01570 [Haemophilus influenzae]GBK77894.1 hypothetical protein NTHIID8_00670 [Haemophilus influenzae]GBK90196.1 hypothetical protein NTHiID19_01530 [Haemophilus influenzae]